MGHDGDDVSNDGEAVDGNRVDLSYRSSEESKVGPRNAKAQRARKKRERQNRKRGRR